MAVSFRQHKHLYRATDSYIKMFILDSHINSYTFRLVKFIFMWFLFTKAGRF